jgi:hypothetical protein
MNVSEGLAESRVLLVMAGAGALAGSLVGVGLGLYCWYTLLSRLAR